VTGPEAGDRVLVERTLAGNAVAFEQLITRYQQAVYATAYALLRDAHAAQDVVQETFLAAYRTLAKLKNPDRPRPWLTGIARNLAISAIRKRKGNTVSIDKVAEPAARAGGESVETEQAEALAALREAVSELSDRQREIVWMRYYEGIGADAIAETLGVSRNVVDVTIFRAKRALGKKLRKKGI
jgi:RNA polymerase sigma-70 factor (ECF subfamily)